MIDPVAFDIWALFFLPALLFGAALSILWIVLLVPMLLVWLWLLARISRKAGFSGWWCLTTFFPPLFAGMIWVLAFIDWRQRTVAYLPPRR
jgi:hypothetical protein